MHVVAPTYTALIKNMYMIYNQAIFDNKIMCMCYNHGHEYQSIE